MGILIKTLGMIEKALDKSHSARMDRATEQGYDIKRKLYHGTNKDIKNFDKSRSQLNEIGDYGEGVYLTGDPYLASGYALKRGEEGANVMPLVARDGGKIYRINIDSNLTEAQQKFKPFQSKEESKAFSDKLKAEGYEGVEVRLRDIDEETGEVVGEWLEEKVVFDPSNIRSTQAAFDPQFKESSNLLGKTTARNLAGVATATTAGLAAPIASNILKRFKQNRLVRAARQGAGTLDAALTVGSGMANLAGAGLAATYGGFRGEDPNAILKHYEDNQAMYLPQTDAGMDQLQGLQNIIQETGDYWGQRGGTQAIDNFQTSQDWLNRQGSKISPEVGAGLATGLGLLPEVL